MCCFVVPMAEAVIVTAATLIMQQTQSEKLQSRNLQAAMHEPQPFYKNLALLAKMLWLVTGVLVIDHAMNGELMWAYPFFTAATSPDGISTMIHEMSTIGVAMSAFITAVWAVMLFARRVKTPAKAKSHS